MATTKNEVIFGLQYENGYLIAVRGWSGGGGWGCGLGGVTSGGGSKNFVEGMYWRKDFSRWGEIIRVLKRIVQKPIQVNIPNLLNSCQVAPGFRGIWLKKESLVNKNEHLH